MNMDVRQTCSRATSSQLGGPKKQLSRPVEQVCEMSLATIAQPQVKTCMTQGYASCKLITSVHTTGSNTNSQTYCLSRTSHVPLRNLNWEKHEEAGSQWYV